MQKQDNQTHVNVKYQGVYSTTDNIVQ